MVFYEYHGNYVINSTRKAFDRAALRATDPKILKELPCGLETKSVWKSCPRRVRVQRPEEFGGAAAAGDPKRLAELPLLIVHFGMGVLHCRWFDFMAIDCLFCFEGADVSFTSV